LVIATTTLTLPILEEVWTQVEQSISAQAKLEVVQIRTKDFLPSLQSRHVDLVIGGVAASAKDPPLEDYDFLEWKREAFCALTNLPKAEFPGDTIDHRDMPKYNLVLPEAGIIIDAIKKWYGDQYAKHLKLMPAVLDVHYAVALLRLGIVKGFIISTKTVAEFVTQTTEPALTVEPGKYELRIINFGEGFNKIDFVCGLHGRRGDRDNYEQSDPNHPLAVFWRVFEQASPAIQARQD
jgi:hypothetical protein